MIWRRSRIELKGRPQAKPDESAAFMRSIQFLTLNVEVLDILDLIRLFIESLPTIRSHVLALTGLNLVHVIFDFRSSPQFKLELLNPVIHRV